MCAERGAGDVGAESMMENRDKMDLSGHMPGLEEFQTVAEVFRLLGDPTRVRLFWLLCHTEESVLELSGRMDMSSPAVSHHLKLLKASGLVVSHREGKEVLYKAAPTDEADALHHIIEDVVEIACPKGGG